VSGQEPLGSVAVALYRTSSSGGGHPVLLGRSQTRANGSFGIAYRTTRGSNAVLYLIAGTGSAVRLASVLGRAPVPRAVVVNERTTVATGFAMAQFIAGREMGGKAPGPQNAAGMAGNLVNVRTGGVSSVLAHSPNGRQTSTWRTFNSLANMLSGCVRTGRCAELFRLAKPPRGRAPQGTLAAVANIARNPWQNVEKLFALSRSGPTPYRPALASSRRPDAWTLALRFVGDGTTMSGPGNMAIDADGNVWVTTNYVYARRRTKPVCGSKLLVKFTPTGRYVKGSPYTGGGLNGAGFGITLDPRGNIWVGNFGFAAPDCTQLPPRNSVSEFAPSGRALSPDATDSAGGSGGGFVNGPISSPQGTVSDRQGNIWIANCGSDNVTRYANGDPTAFRTFGNLGVLHPFDIAFNGRGQAFVTSVGNNRVAMLNADGTPTSRSPISQGGLNKPLGIAADSRGDMWVANSGLIDIPCPTPIISTDSIGGSLTLLGPDGVPKSGQALKGGGLTVPWGVAVDGNDNVWVANFAGKRLSQFCGVKVARCPPGVRTGQAISPRTGYGFDGLVRNTGVQIDPSGNVWVANNWKTVPIQANPGGYEMVVYVGLAGPLRTPLIGPPRPL
jgi:sugar lactone lactonase YvrE